MKLPYSRCGCKISKLKFDLKQEFDEQLISGTPYPHLIEAFGGSIPNLSKPDITFHKKHLVILEVQADTPDAITSTTDHPPLTDLPTEADRIEALKKIASTEIIKLTNLPHRTNIENSQLLSWLDIQRKFLESSAKETEKNTVSPIEIAEFAQSYAREKKRTGTTDFTDTPAFKWGEMHKRLGRTSTGSEIFIFPWQDNYGTTSPMTQKRCLIESCPICLSLRSNRESYSV